MTQLYILLPLPYTAYTIICEIISYVYFFEKGNVPKMCLKYVFGIFQGIPKFLFVFTRLSFVIYTGFVVIYESGKLLVLSRVVKNPGELCKF